MEADMLVNDYLGRLEAAAWPLNADRRRELVAEVREHIESALAESGARDEVTTRNVLERLGAPEEIVAAEVGSPGSEGQSPVVTVVQIPGRRGWGASEVAAIAFLTVGAVFLPIIGPLIGLAFVWSADAWSTRQKWVATAIVAVLLVLPILFLLGLTTGSSSGQSLP
ncbi:MAG TPA: hypothetical protein VH987_04460 [Candidatus Limnocylindria bacterium]|jgi:hypothetical protein